MAIDLTPTGLGGTIRAPGQAAVEAEDDGEALRITGGDDFDMVVRRGVVDLWALRCTIASERSRELVRFIENVPTRLRYTVAGGSGERFHFVARGKVGGRSYSCRSLGDGASSEESLQVMIDACMNIDFTSAAEAREAVPTVD